MFVGLLWQINHSVQLYQEGEALFSSPPQDFGLLLLCPKRLIPVTNHIDLPVPRLTHFSRRPWSCAARAAQFGLPFREFGIGSRGEVKGPCIHVGQGGSGY